MPSAHLYPSRGCSLKSHPYRRLSLLSSAVAVAAALVLSAGAAHAATTILPPDLNPSIGPIPLGQPITVAVSAHEGGDVPVGYRYQVGDGPGVGRFHTVAAVDGRASITVTARSRSTFLSVWSVDADGTRSGSTTALYESARRVPSAKPGDLDGDGVPDLLTNGGTPGLPSGLWQATGRQHPRDGRVHTPAVDIGVNGGGLGYPPSFDGAQVITGDFTGAGWQDVFAYYPSGPLAGAAVIVDGTGDGSVLLSQYETEVSLVSQGTFTDDNGDNPVQVVNAYHAGASLAYDDLLTVNGDPSIGYHLAYYPNQNGIGMYYIAVALPNTTPTGGTDWANWRLSSTQVASGTAVYLWNQGTGALYLWEGLTFTDNGDGTGAIAFHQYRISDNWNHGVPLSTVEAADFTGDGIPDLWTVTAQGTVTADVVTDLSQDHTATVTERRPQSLR